MERNKISQVHNFCNLCGPHCRSCPIIIRLQSIKINEWLLLSSIWLHSGSACRLESVWKRTRSNIAYKMSPHFRKYRLNPIFDYDNNFDIVKYFYIFLRLAFGFLFLFFIQLDKRNAKTLTDSKYVIRSFLGSNLSRIFF